MSFTDWFKKKPASHRSMEEIELLTITALNALKIKGMSNENSVKLREIILLLMRKGQGILKLEIELLDISSDIVKILRIVEMVSLEDYEEHRKDQADARMKMVAGLNESENQIDDVKTLLD